MKKATQLIFLLGLVVSMTGCATSGYLAKRGRDAADVFTATVGVGAGAKARAGPFHAGLFLGSDNCGLRGGTLLPFLTWDENLDSKTIFPLKSIDVDLLVFPVFDDDFPGWPFFALEHFGREEVVDAGRGKHYSAFGILPLFYFLGVEGEETMFSRRSLPQYTQIEAVVGLGATFRLGVNPGEILDFLLGWTTVDIFDDDIPRDIKRVSRRRKQKRYPSGKEIDGIVDEMMKEREKKSNK